MRDHIQNFIGYLMDLQKDKTAMAILKRGLGFKPGSHFHSYPYVEHFLSHDSKESYRRSLYLVASLFAYYPHHDEDNSNSFAAVFARVAKEKESKSMAKRFISLLEAEKEDLSNHLRQAFSLLPKQEGKNINFVKLAKDISHWSSSNKKVKEKWARDFYRIYQPLDQPQKTN